MAKGISIHVGINDVDGSEHSRIYNYVPRKLVGAENSAVQMCRIASHIGFNTQLLIGEHATKSRVLERIQKAAQELQPHDMLFVSICCHGLTSFSLNKARKTGLTASDSRTFEESLILYDKRLVDDEIRPYWNLFRPGVRIFILIDSCFATSILDGDEDVVEKTRIKKQIDDRSILKTHDNRIVPRVRDISPLVIAIASSAERGLAFDADASKNEQITPFTQAVVDTWKNGTYQKDYREFYHDIYKWYVQKINNGALRSSQYPSYITIGKDVDESDQILTPFEQQIPFRTIK